MKFVLIALALIGAAAALNVPQPKSVSDAVDIIFDWIPTDGIQAIVQSCEDDEEIVRLKEFLRGDVAAAAIQRTRDDADIQNFFDDLKAAGVQFRIINFLFGLWGIPGIESAFSSNKLIVGKADCGGWRGVFDQIEELMTLEALADKILEVAANDAEFGVIMGRIGDARPQLRALVDTPEWQDVIAYLTGHGVEVDRLYALLNKLFGWE